MAVEEHRSFLWNHPAAGLLLFTWPPVSRLPFISGSKWGLWGLMAAEAIYCRKSTSLAFFLLFDRKRFSSISQRDNVVLELMHVAVRVCVMEIKLFITWGEQGAEINRHWDLSIHTVQPGWCYKYIVSRHSVVYCINKLWDSVLCVC